MISEDRVIDKVNRCIGISRDVRGIAINSLVLLKRRKIIFFFLYFKEKNLLLIFKEIKREILKVKENKRSVCLPLIHLKDV